MARKDKMVPVEGSHRKPALNARDIGAVQKDKLADVTLRLRSRTSEKDIEQRVQDIATKPISERRYLTREELADLRGASPEDLAKIDAFAHDHNLTVVESSVPKRMVRLHGKLEDLQSAFGVKLRRYRTSNTEFRGRTGQVFVPAEISNIVEGVFGLDTRPAAKPHVRILDGAMKSKSRPAKTVKAGPDKKKKKPKPPAQPRPVSFKVTDIFKLYNFPTNLDGTGQTIGIIELNTPSGSGGNPDNLGAGYTASDLDKFFSNLKLKTPSVTPVSVNGGANIPNVNPSADGEVTLDIEVAGAAAPGAKIAVYFAPNTDQGFIDAVSAAVHDSVRKPSVISISWGGPEEGSTQQFMTGMDSVLRDAALLGVTVCCASGDSGSSDLNQSDGKPHADFPASSTYALGCGGTELIGSGSTIESEVVWNAGQRGGAGGGGVSNVFALPAYQQQANVPKSPTGTKGRGVPDVSGNADPQTGYQIVLGGKTVVIGGTSAVAPLWAGLVALMNEQLSSNGAGPVGFLNTSLYQLPPGSGSFRDITQGNNDIFGDLGLYQAAPGWDACTGLGTPNGKVLIQNLAGVTSGTGANRVKTKRAK